MIAPPQTYLSRLKLTNHKCFYEPTAFDFGPGFNILIGESSSGKSVVLEALDHSTTVHPHRSHGTLSSLQGAPFEHSTIELHYQTIASEVAQLANQPHLFLGATAETGENIELTSSEWQTNILNGPLHFGHRRTSFASWQDRLCLASHLSSWHTAGHSDPACYSMNVTAPGDASTGSSADAQWPLIRSTLGHRTYRFLTERRIAPSCGFSTPELASDGSNLAFCLNHLKSHNGALHAQLNRLVQHVLPAVKSVNSVPENNGFSIKISHVEADEIPATLAFGLSEVGTGVGNVIAMIYVMLTAQQPRTILLEEPNSYLHPRALRELLAILGESDIKHQYFITTHSSEVLRSVNASTVTQLAYDGDTSRPKQVAGGRVGELRAGLMDMGIRMSDLHGCDRVIWVEGQTEEAVFPQLIRKYFPAYAASTAVLRVHATSDFEGEIKANHLDPLKVANIYRKLSDGNALAPMMLGIILDREGRTKTECEKIEKASDASIRFLAPPMLEDYFLHASAIANLIQQRTGREVPIVEIDAKLTAAKTDRGLWLRPRANASEVHAAKTLSFICHEFSAGEMEYKKTRDGPVMVEYLMQHEPTRLEGLHTLLGQLLT